MPHSLATDWASPLTPSNSPVWGPRTKHVRGLASFVVIDLRYGKMVRRPLGIDKPHFEAAFTVCPDGRSPAERQTSIVPAAAHEPGPGLTLWAHPKRCG